MAPLVVGDLVIAGVSGGDEGIRGFVAAYRVNTGEQAWRFWTVPARGEPGSETWKGNVDLEEGGGATWLTGTYDRRDRHAVLADRQSVSGHGRQRAARATTSTPTPCSRSTRRPESCGGTTSSRRTICGTGTRRSRRSSSTPSFQGRPRKLLLQANRNGFFYVLDRTDGKVLLAKPFVQKLTWASGIGPDGRPQLRAGQHARRKRRDHVPRDSRRDELDVHVVQPGDAAVLCDGGRELLRLSQHDVRRRPRRWRCAARSRRRRAGARAGSGARRGPGSRRSALPGEGSTAADLAAAARWRCARSISTPGASRGRFRRSETPTTTRERCRPRAGSCSTVRRAASLRRSMRRSGAHLWHFETQETWKSSPMTYTVNGRQYVAITSGANVLAFALPGIR